MLLEKELERYNRQIMILGTEGQNKLKTVKVFIAGAGGLGSSVSLYLAAAGVGKIKVADHDAVKLDNLNRQILYTDEDLGKKKSITARNRLVRVNPHVDVEETSESIDENNAHELVRNFDTIVDAMDNYPTRYLLNRAALMNNIPMVHGAVHGLSGQITTIIPGKTACLRCIFPEAPSPSSAFPIVGVACGILGCLQAVEVIKSILGIGKLLENKLLLLDVLNSSVDEIEVSKNPKCSDCGKG